MKRGVEVIGPKTSKPVLDEIAQICFPLKVN